MCKITSQKLFKDVYLHRKQETNNPRKEFTMTKKMNEQQFIKLYMKLKRSGKSVKEIEQIITKWQTEGDDEGVKLVLV